MQSEAPLAARMRPRTLEEFIGQEHIVGEGKLLRRAIALNRTPEWRNCRTILTFAAEMTEADGELQSRVSRMQGAAFDLWHEAVAAAQESGEVRTDISPDVAAQWIWFTIAGFVLARKLDGERVPAERVIERMLDHLMPTQSTEETSV